MSLQVPIGPSADPSSRVLQLPLVAVGATADRLRSVTGGLPAGAVAILLVRTGLWPETLNPVTVEVALTVDRDVMAITDLAFFRHLDGTLWLVPAQTGPFVAITPDGLGLEMTAPFQTWSDRFDGVCRAAAEIVRITRRGWAC